MKSEFLQTILSIYCCKRQNKTSDIFDLPKKWVKVEFYLSVFLFLFPFLKPNGQVETHLYANIGLGLYFNNLSRSASANIDLSLSFQLSYQIEK